MLNGNLPDGWTLTTIGDIADTTSGGTPLRSHPEYYGGGIPWVKSGELREGVIRDVEETITELGLKNSSAKMFPKDTVVVALYGATVGRTGILGLDATSNQAVCGIFPHNNSFISKYMFFWLQSQRKNLINQSMGGAQPNISQGIIRSLLFPLAPLPEQERIVAKIEELFTQLEAGTAALKRVRVGLKRYKASVLKAACEGRLFSDVGAHGMRPSTPAGRTPSARTGAGALPEGWRWVTTELLADGSKHALKAGPFGSSLKKECYVLKGYKIYGQEQVIRGDPHYGDYYIDKERYEELKSNAVKPGDILISLVGTIGKVLILPDNIEQGIINPRLVKLSLDKNLIDSKYFKNYLETEKARHYFSTVSHGETMKILNLGILKKLPVPLPSLVEQRRIVAEVERRLSVAAQVESVVAGALARASRLRQAVLKAAFEGKLV